MTRSHAIAALLGISALAVVGAAPPDHLEQCLHESFTGITQTLADGTIVGDPDRGDWGCASHGGGANATPAVPGGGTTAPNGVPPPPPTALCMQPAAPNPTDGAIRLQFSLPAAGQVSLIVYGRHQGHGPRETFVVRTLMDANLVVGSFAVTWDLKDDHGVRLEPGIYRAVLVAGDEALCGDIEVR
jgi:hypothetical protein